MSLDYQLGGIKDWETVCKNPTTGKLKGSTETLIWITIPTLMGEITEKNKDEFLLRCRMYENMRGAMRTYPDGRAVFVSREEVEAHVGLRTNAHTESMPKFRKHLISLMERDAKEEL